MNKPIKNTINIDDLNYLIAETNEIASTNLDQINSNNMPNQREGDDSIDDQISVDDFKYNLTNFNHIDNNNSKLARRIIVNDEAEKNEIRFKNSSTKSSGPHIHCSALLASSSSSDLILFDDNNDQKIVSMAKDLLEASKNHCSDNSNDSFTHFENKFILQNTNNLERNVVNSTAISTAATITNSKSDIKNTKLEHSESNFKTMIGIECMINSTNNDSCTQQLQRDATTNKETTKKGRKRSLERSSQQPIAKKKSKSQFQRKNIKKIISEKKLNEVTLKALQEEQERQRRLAAGNTSENYSTTSSLFSNDLALDSQNNNNNVALLETVNEKASSDNSVLIVDGEESCDEISLEVEGDDLDDSASDDYSFEADVNNKSYEKIANAECSKFQNEILPSVKLISPNGLIHNNNQRFKSESCLTSLLETKRYKPAENDEIIFTTIDDSNENEDELDYDDDDCKILSDSERDEEPKKAKPHGMHMDDSLNIPDSSGRVLVNLNHPSHDMDIYLLPFLARNVKPHQIGGIRFMYDNIVENLRRVEEKSDGFGCILAHAMGLGKTFQVISFIEIFLRCTSSKRVMCIVPINTIQNWLAEFNSWLPENGQQRIDDNTIINYNRPFKIFLINDSAKTLKQRIDIILEWKRIGGVLLIGYEMFRTLITTKTFKQPSSNSNNNSSASNQKKNGSNVTDVIDLEEEDKNQQNIIEMNEALLTPCLVVCDEGHRIKNSSANIAKTLQTIKTKRRIVLTGYPLQNNLIEYWCMVDFVRPSYLGTKSEFTNMFERPIMNGQCIDSTREDVKLMRYRAHVLHSLLEGFVQRRGHDVFLSTLPKKFEYIILLKLSSIQRELYLSFMEAIGATNQNERSNPLRSFAICCKLWNHPDVLHRFYLNKESDIDLDLPELQQSTSSNSSKNNKQKSANIKQQANCSSLLQFTSTNSSLLMLEDSGFNPFASHSLNQADKKMQGNNVAQFDANWANKIMETYQPNRLENGAKFLMAFSIIEKSIINGDNILLFSQSLLTLNLIEEYLQKFRLPVKPSDKWQKNKNYFRLDGSTSGTDRERLINAFNKKDSDVWLFLLSTRAGCLGINLIGANRVIVLDASWVIINSFIYILFTLYIY